MNCFCKCTEFFFNGINLLNFRFVKNDFFGWFAVPHFHDHVIRSRFSFQSFHLNNFHFLLEKINADIRMLLSEILDAVKLATQPLSNSIRALAMSGVSETTATPEADILRTLDFTTLRIASMS